MPIIEEAVHRAGRKRRGVFDAMHRGAIKRRRRGFLTMCSVWWGWNRVEAKEQGFCSPGTNEV